MGTRDTIPTAPDISAVISTGNPDNKAGVAGIRSPPLHDLSRPSNHILAMHPFFIGAKSTLGLHLAPLFHTPVIRALLLKAVSALWNQAIRVRIKFSNAALLNLMLMSERTVLGETETPWK